jgi:hypothetical protein
MTGRAGNVIGDSKPKSVNECVQFDAEIVLQAMAVLAKIARV